MYLKTKEAELYQRLKHYADEAYDKYLSRPSYYNWEEANRTEEEVADYALEHEDKIFA